MAKLLNRDCRTICLETGVQNFTLTIAIITLSFKDESARNNVLLFPITYGFCYIINSVLIVLFLKNYVSTFDESESTSSIVVDQEKAAIKDVELAENGLSLS